MSLSTLGWWAIRLWASGAILAGGAGLLVVFHISSETPDSPRPWRVRLLRFVCGLLVISFLAACWPIILTVQCFQFRRERLLDRAYRGQLPGKADVLTEADWLSATDAATLLVWLGKRLSPRKRRLVAVACCRRIWNRVLPLASRNAVETTERYLDGLATHDELLQATSEAARATLTAALEGDMEIALAARACQDAGNADAARSALRAAHTALGLRKQEARQQCQVVREIVGNPFRPLPPRDFPPHVRILAQSIALGDEELWPVLADALDELDEIDAASHCREPGHLPGCHVLEWVLGKD
jgi:hypothetical protein